MGLKNLKPALCLLLAALCPVACTTLTLEEQAELGIPPHLRVAPPGQEKPEGVDPILINSLFDLLEVSDRIAPDISQVEGTPFEEILKVGSPTGYAIRNRYLHPGVPLAEALSEDPDPVFRKRLLELARWDRSDEVRSTALVSLARMKNVDDEMVFREASAHIEPAVRFGAMEALSVWGHPEQAVPILKSAAENDRQYVLRVFAAAGMARLGSDEGVQKLRDFLDNGDWMVRAMAARYLGEFGEGKDYDLMLERASREENNDFVLAEDCIAAIKLFAKRKNAP